MASLLFADLDAQLGRLSLQVPPTKLSEELEEIGLVIFEPVCSLGFFTWRPDGKKIRYEKLNAITEEDITETNRLDMNGRPPTLNIPKVRMPYLLSTASSAAVSFDNKFPYGQLECVHLHAATRRGVDWTATDFCLGGSVLSMLADRCIATDPYFCCKIPHTAGTILVAKCKSYTVDWGDAGHQFERLVTGSTAGGPCAIEFTEHLQLMKVGRFDVLFRAEVDAISAETGQPIEIKASNPRYWGTKVMLQMISSGSTLLCEGSKSRGSLVKITTRSLASVASDAIHDRTHLKRLESNILQGLSDIKKKMEGVDDGLAHKIAFVGSMMQLEPIRTRAASSLLPNDAVMKALLTNSNIKVVVPGKEKSKVSR